LSEIRDQIKAAVPIDIYIGRTVALKKQGKYYSGLCPFHGEKTPSFFVYPDKGFFRCYGCQKGGDIFTFVMEKEGVAFSEALEILARFAGIKTKPDAAKNKHAERLYELNEKTTGLFVRELAGNDGISARKYLDDRGVSADARGIFRIGFAGEDWQFLEKHLSEYGRELKELGLIKEKDGRTYDFFRGRIIFPIFDAGGRVIAFGGRVLPGDEKNAKYLNSSESILFKKSHILYGFFQASSAIRAARECFLVEGYLDVIGLHQAGVQNAVAPLGTALTADHMKFLERYTQAICAVFDGDRAGRAAALKFARLAQEHPHIKSTVVLLREGTDAFDLASGAQKSRLEAILSSRIGADRYLLSETLLPNAYSLFSETAGGLQDPLDFSKGAASFYQEIEKQTRALSMEEKRNAIRRLFELITTLPRPTDRELYLEEGAKILGIEPAALRQERKDLFAGTQAQESRIPVAIPARKKGPSDRHIERAERDLILEFLFSPAALAETRSQMQDFVFEDEHSELVYRYLEGLFFSGDVWKSDSLFTSDLPSDTVAVFSRSVQQRQDMSYSREPEEILSAVQDFMNDHELRIVENDLQAVKNEMNLADPSNHTYLLEKQAGLLKKKGDLKHRRREGTEGSPKKQAGP